MTSHSEIHMGWGGRGGVAGGKEGSTFNIEGIQTSTFRCIYKVSRIQS